MNITGRIGTSCRIKAPESIVRKRVLQRAAGAESRVLNDVIGLRLIVAHKGLLKNVVNILPGWAAEWDLTQAKWDDRTTQPDPSGYRALHVNFRLLPNNEWELPTNMGVEVQVSSWLMHLHATLAREMAYPVQHADAANLETLRSVAARLNLLDEELKNIFSTPDSNSIPR